MKKDILDIIGNTPMIEIDTINIKLETYNLTGSVKDRVASYVIKKAERNHQLHKGSKILEATSGNTGIALAAISALRGYKFTAIMPEFASKERLLMIKKFGGKVILTPSKENIQGVVTKYNQMMKSNKYWTLDQFNNSDNIRTHELFTAKEILRQTNGKIDIFVASIGTGGTLIGIAKALKKYNKKIQIVGIEPYNSAVLSKRKPGFHKIQGIGEGFIPKIVMDNKNLIDRIILIKDRDAIKSQKYLAQKHGLLVGISSGANFFAAKQLKKKTKKIVTIFPDRGERYLSL